MKEPTVSLKERVNEFVTLKSKLYHPIPHPAFMHLPVAHGPERFDMIVPHLKFRGGSALDIGANWGYIAHRLEGLGYKVTAVESGAKAFRFMSDIRDLCDDKFEAINKSIFDLEDVTFDVIVALNIFHHFLKTKDKFREFESLLSRMKCRQMIYQAHAPGEKQMVDAFSPMTSEELAHFIADRIGLTVKPIGLYRTRMIYTLEE
jgi:2-polyprenyl-3-methyl-5-hydroxy-6-metoxy-1,4-benzoquinol methylase